MHRNSGVHVAFSRFPDRGVRENNTPFGGAWRLQIAATVAVWAVAMGLLAPAIASAQETADENGKPLSPPIDVALETKDFVQLRCTYYPGRGDRNTTPVILVHGLKGTRQSLGELAEALQAKGHCVIVPDLRGHGDSTSVRGTNKRLEVETMPPMHFQRMAAKGGDFEKVKSYLVEQHNASKCNIEKLCVVACDVGCLVALNWTLLDWDWPVLATGKQGQDVQALAFISPPFKYKMLNPNAALKQEFFTHLMPVYITVGAQDPKSAADAKRLYDALAKHRKKPEDIAEPDKEQTLYYLPKDSNLQGVELIGEPTLEVIDNIVKFIDLRIESRPTPWKERKNPLK